MAQPDIYSVANNQLSENNSLQGLMIVFSEYAAITVAVMPLMVVTSLMENWKRTQPFIPLKSFAIYFWYCANEAILIHFLL